MQTTLTINDMHCNACKTLITMELEEHGFAESVSSFEVLPGQNKGIITVENLSEEKIKELTSLINSIDNYSVV